MIYLSFVSDLFFDDFMQAKIDEDIAFVILAETNVLRFDVQVYYLQVVNAS